MSVSVLLFGPKPPLLLLSVFGVAIEMVLVEMWA